MLKRPRPIRTSFIIATSSFLGCFFAIYFIFNYLTYVSKGALVESILSLVPKKQMNGINILAVGIDEEKLVQRSDTIMVLHINEETNRIGVISIPRDTRTMVSGIGMSKINHAYAHGGMKTLQETISSFLNIPIHYHVKIDLKGIEGLVNSLGGIPVHVKKNLIYKDKAANFSINIPKGTHTLKGEEVTAYLRFRKDTEGDIGRIRRQQTFLKALMKKVLHSEHILKSPGVFKKLSKLVDSNLSLREIIGFVTKFSVAYKQGSIHVGTIPGIVGLIDGVSYWRPDIIGMDQMIERVLFGFESSNIVETANFKPDINDQSPVVATIKPTLIPTKEKKGPPLSSKNSSIKKTPKKVLIKKHRKVTLEEVSRITEQTDLSDEVAHKSIQNILKIEVLNGSGMKGLAKKVARFLKKEGFKIARFDNSGSFNYKKTLIVDWKGNVQNTLILADILHIDPSNIIVHDRPKKTLDVTLVVGKDWPQILRKFAQLKKNESP